MARTPSTMRLSPGDAAPDFLLPNYNTAVGGETVALGDIAGENGSLVMFICNHCPFVKHIADELAKLGHYCQSHGIGVVAIQPNDVDNYPDDAPDRMTLEADSRGYTFPYLHDADQTVAKTYSAACTPDFFLLDANRDVFYRGQLDDARPGSDEPVTGADLRGAIAQLLAGNPAPSTQKPSIGCNIKWIPGSEPDYFG
ncbi:MAG: thioredoxin family protein [Planctomycetota bacterium]